MIRRRYTLTAISLILVAVYHIFTVSYGRYNEIVYATTQTVASHESYAD